MKTDSAPPRVREPAISLAIVVITVLAFWRVTTCDFVNFDDYDYVVDNPNVRQGLTGRGFAWAITALHSFNWHPLTWLSHMADCQMFGLHPNMHHLTSLVFHVLNSVLLFHIFARMTGAIWRSATVAALFAVHPLHVESVAWIAERKDVLSGLFWFLTMWAYVEYARKRTRRAYLLSILFFILGILAKPMVVTLPFVLLLMDLWPLRRIRFAGGSPDLGGAGKPTTRARGAKPRSPAPGFGRTPLNALILEKLPFFALAAFSSVMTFVAQRQGGAVASFVRIPVDERMANALTSYCAYLGKLAWPAGLCVLYPFKPTLPPVEALGAAAVLIAISAAVVWQWRTRPYLGVGWFWYLGMLVPVIGLVQVGSQAMADRYMYIPSIGVSIVLTWGLTEVAGRLRIRPAISGIVAGGVLLALAWRTHDQVRYWRNSVTMYERALSVTSNNPLMERSFGVTLVQLGRLDEAKRHLDEAVRMSPRYADAYYARGVLGDKQGDPVGAEADYRKALQLDPDLAIAHERLGALLFNQGRMAEAIEEFATTLRLSPMDAQAGTNYGAALVKAGRYSEAAEQFRRALEIQPDFPAARNYLAKVEEQLRASPSRTGDRND